MKKFSFSRRKSVFFFVLAILLFTLLFFFVKKGVFLSEDARFEKFTRQLFTEEVRSNTLNLHYTLAYPEKYGIKDYPISLGTMKISSMKNSYAALENYRKKLEAIDMKKLSHKNQITYDILRLDFATQLSGKNLYMLKEPLSPNLGIQSQLPVLLAEYTFRTAQDIKDYFKLLSSMPDYFEEILTFEQEKSKAGLFMSDTTAQRIIDQCNAFCQSSDTNYINTIFEEKVESYVKSGAISKNQGRSYIKTHQNIIEKRVLPAYEKLSSGLAALKGTGTNVNGLSYLPGGSAYYQYLIRNDTGDYRSVDEIEKRLSTQLLADYQEMQNILTEHPELISSLSEPLKESTTTPAQMLDYLNQAISNDFPDNGKPDFKVKYVHSSMEDFTSPAFYLTPPTDTLSPNIIYINKGSTVSQEELFTTLAHEGFPGHLYQTQYFGSTKPDQIRSLMSFGGYVEGWATYVESISYGYAADYLKTDPSYMRLLWLNRSISLCLYSMLDIGIHSRGWDEPTVIKLLNSFGVSNEDSCREIFQYIVENPVNYLKYYLGYLNFMDLKSEAQKSAGNSFQLKTFHKQLLELGPAQFPVIEKYMATE